MVLRRHGLHDHTRKMGPARPSRQPDRVSFETRWAAWGRVTAIIPIILMSLNKAMLRNVLCRRPEIRA